MKITLLILLAISTMANAQEQNIYADSLFTALQAEKTNWEPWFISLEDYHKIIEKQPMNQSSKNDFKSEVNQSYEAQLQDFISEMNHLQEQYNIVEEKSNFKIDTIETELLEGVKNIYFFRLFIQYTFKKRTDQYVLEFQAALLNNKWLMMEPLKEYYQ